jgi:hypothetical protein
MAFNLSRAAAVLADGKLGKARTATIGTKLINIPARLAISAGTYNLHLPADSRRETPFMTSSTTSWLQPKRPDPLIVRAIPGPTQRHPDTADGRSGDTGYPAT